MRLQKLPDGGLRLSRMNPWEVQTLRNLPALADFSDHAPAERRLLPSPAIESDLTPEMAMDWVEFVVPELRDSFAANLGVVMADLDALKRHEPDPASSAPEAADDPAGKENNNNSGSSSPGSPDNVPEPPAVIDHYLVDIPVGHAEAWFRAMNQARLVLSAKHGIDSENLPDLASLLASGKLEHWFQYELFVSLQGRLIDMALDPEPEPVEDAPEPDGAPGPDSGSGSKADAGPDSETSSGTGSDKPED